MGTPLPTAVLCLWFVVCCQPAAAAESPPATGMTAVPVAEADMSDLHLFIDAASLASGSMPSPGHTYTALVRGGSPAATRVRDGAIILLAARGREGVWAYETQALTRGGLVVGHNGVEEVSAAELRRRLGK
jgi:hypothetical protein